ncbi:helix-turn-helix domain-containing protein [Salinimicrobium sp. GXAS 041]|uniref:helix-turn-helix domain-containing protein n=1 Tax=Salinimicrobium sp. GXAS 041 TaxID=3400806 RepID=UPI003C78A39A
MYTKTDKEKIEKICQMILEVASGNFSYRIERSRHNDQLETIIVLLNMMAEEIRESFHHFALINPHETYKQIAQMTFILDDQFYVRNFNSSAQQLLGLSFSELNGAPFEKFLTIDSADLWKKEIEEIKKSNESPYYQTLRLFFSSSNSLTVPALCSVSSLALKKEDRKLFLVTALQTIIQSQEKEKNIQLALQNLKSKGLKSKKKQRYSLYREADKKKIQKIYDYILNNLEKPLPALRELALKHGTNEFKLKIGFRQLYNTSVFRFQKDQRLQRAHSFIVNTDIPLSRIAEICGFKSFPHFSKIFKTKYGYNPSDLRNQKLE